MAPSLQHVLNADRALIFRVTHRANIPWLLKNGLHCSSSQTKDPTFVTIGSTELIEKRGTRSVPIALTGTLSDYIPFYFTPRSPMLLNIRTGYAGVAKTENHDLVFLVASLRKLAEGGVAFVYTDRHAYLQTARFSADLDDLDRIDWGLLQKQNFQRDPENPGKFDAYQAEALVHRRLPAAALLGISCYDPEVQGSVRAEVDSCGLDLLVETRPDWYF